MSIIRVENLCKNFAQIKKTGRFKREKTEFRAVNNVSFDINAGEAVAFIGPNGAGKSTTLKMLSGILYPDSGSISVAGYTPWQERHRLAHEIGIVFGQRSQLWANLPVQESFRLLAAMYGVKDGALEARIDVLSAMLSLGTFLKQPARALSLGQRMRCEIAAALLHRPQIIFLDEPTIGLDIEAKIALRQNLKQLANQEQATIMLTSHDSDDIEEICQRVIMIDHGEIKQDAPLKTLRADFDRYKILTLYSDEEIDINAMPAGCALDHHENAKYIMKIDRDHGSLREATAHFLTQYNIHDFSVENMPLDELIQRLYAVSSNGAGSKAHA